jgi:ABC-type transport system substrate-binding protein
VRVKNGQRLSLLMVYGQGSDIGRNVAVEVQQMWHAVGVELEPKAFPYAQLYAVAQDGGIFLGGKFDVGFYAWISGGDPDDSSQWLSTAFPPNGNNVDRYASPEMDAAQHLALSTFDQSIRKRAYAQVQRLLVDDVPAIFLFYPPQRYGFTPELRNFTPNGVGEAWNAADWTFTSP